MRWILENLNLIIIIAGAVAWWLNQRAREKAGESADYDDDGIPEVKPRETVEDPEIIERTRRIRAEIEKKIAERRRAGEGYTEPARPAEATLRPEAPVIRIPGQEQVPVPVEEAPPLIRTVRVPSAANDSRRTAEILEQQAALAEQLRQAQEMKVAAQRRRAFEATTRDQSAVQRLASRDAVITDLHDTHAVRRAFVLREVLGPPVALR
jgi:hypothetical protein